MPLFKKWNYFPFRMFSILFLMGIWWIVSLFLSEKFLPGPLLVFRSVVDIFISGEFFKEMAKTFARVLIGFSFALFISVLVGVAMGIWKNIEKLFEPEILIGLTIPALCWTAISMMLFGLGEGAAVFSIVVLVSPMLVVNVLAGMKALDWELVEMARSFHASRRLIIAEVALPQLVPYILAGTRYGLGLAWKIVVIAEMMGLSNGIGYKISFWYGVFSMKEVLAWTLSFSSMMFIIEYGILGQLEKRLTRWRVHTIMRI
jgi:NitT/TauT family transport system permease protein